MSDGEQISNDSLEGGSPMSQPQISGLIVSLPGPIIDRIFHHRDTYVHPSSDAANFLKAGSRVFFYDALSQGLIGEAVVAKVVLERWDRLSQYGQHLFLSPDELDQYAREKGLKRDEPLLVLELDEAIKYMNPMKCPLAVPSSGLRVTREVHDEIARVNR